MNTKNNNKEVQEDIELLLPWHAAGTLSRRDAARVEQALANDNDLAARYEVVREELGEAIRLNESLGAPSARAMQALFAKIDAEPVRKPKASFQIGVFLTSFVASFSPRTLAYGATAAALAIVLQAGLLAGVLVKENKATTQLASYGQQSDTGSYLLVGFRPQASVAEITKFLMENKASVASGPASGSGLYRIRVSETTLPRQELVAIAKRMQTDPVISLTLP